MIIKRVNVFSAAKISAVLYAIMGFIFGLIFAFFGMIGSMFARSSDMPAGFGMFFGLGGIIIMPIFYGIIGFIATAIAAWLYNIIAGWVGGVEIDVEGGPSSAVPQHQAPYGQ